MGSRRRKQPVPKYWRYIALLLVALGALLQPLLPERETPPSLPPFSAPQSTQPLVYLQNIGYHTGYDPKTRLPAWVYYRLDWSRREPSQYARPNSFEADQRVANPVQSRLYTTNGLTADGYQRGHMAPSSTIGNYYGRKAQIETFLLTNIVPQKDWHNERIWNSLERIEANDYAKRYGIVEIWTGPVFGETPKVQGLPIPNALYKIIRRPDGRCLAFIIPQNGPEIPSHLLHEQLTTVAEIEQQTGLTFPSIAEEIKPRPESRLW